MGHGLGQEGVGGPLVADVGRGAVAAEHDRVIGQRKDDPRERLQQGSIGAAREVGTADAAGEDEVTGEEHRGRLAPPEFHRLRRGERHRTGRVARREVDPQPDPGKVEHLPAGQLPDVVGLGPLQAAEQGDALRQPHGRPGVGELAAVRWVYVGGDVARAAHGHHRERVVEVPVGEDHGDRLEAVLAQARVDVVVRADARVDDDAFLPRAGRHDVAVRIGGTCGEAVDQHDNRG